MQQLVGSGEIPPRAEGFRPLAESGFDVDVKEQLKGIRDRALKLIGEAAGRGDTSIITHYSGVIQESESLLARIERIQSEVDRLAQRIDAPEQKPEHPRRRKEDLEPRRSDEGATPKMKGEARRTEFVEHLESIGIRINQRAASQFVTAGGRLVGVAYASERNPNHWFLGLPIKEYDSIVFLCENKKGMVAAFVLPRRVCKKYLQQFSASGNNFKFNIQLRGSSSYRLHLPGAGSLSLNEFQNEYSSLSD